MPGRLGGKPVAKTRAPRDGDMIAAASLGREGIRILFLEHHASLVRFLRRLINDDDEVADIAQEAYYRLLRHNEKGALRGYERAYLFKTAINLIRERHRRRCADPVVERGHNGTALEAISQAPSPERTLEWRQGVDLMREALLDLPAAERRMFVLHRLRGRTCAEIAAACGVSERTVRRRLAAAIAHCRDRLRDFR